MVAGLVVYNFWRWLVNWFTKWILLECSPRISKLHCLLSSLHSNWQSKHMFPFSLASWLLNHLNKALHLFGWLASGFENVQRSHPTNIAIRIQSQICFKSISISWLLSIVFLLDLWAEPPLQAFIRWIHPICTSVWNVYTQTTFTSPNAPWDHWQCCDPVLVAPSSLAATDDPLK